MRRRHFKIIHNPTAGRRKWRRLASVVANLEEHGAVVDQLTTQYAGHAHELARENIGKSDVIVAAGGDGTLAEVVSGLRGSDQTMGLVPMGTANVAAHDLGLINRSKTDWSCVCNTLLEGHLRPLHIGRARSSAGERLFIMMIGVGFDASAVCNVDPLLKKRWGKLSYIVSGARMLRRYRSHRLCLDGRQMCSPWIVIANGRHYAGPYVISRYQTVFSPGLTAMALQRQGRLGIVRALVSLVSGNFDQQPAMDIRCGAEFSIESLENIEIPVQIDGDAFGTTPLFVDMIKETVQILSTK